MKNKSYEKIDYRIRTRKFVERKMILESCKKLFYFDKLNNYQYIGFGSLYFVDFKMFHKYFNINDMTSIEYEDDLNIQQRFEFNKPYNFIKMNFNKSTDALRKIDFDKRSIVWLDYDSNLSTYMFEDIEILVDKMKSGSIFAISLNTSIDGNRTSKLLIELNKIKEKLSSDVISEKLSKENIIGELNEVIDSIKSIITSSNRDKIEDQMKNYLQELKNIINKLKLDKNSTNQNIKLLNPIFTMLSNGSYCKEKIFRKGKFTKDFQDYVPKREILENELTEKKSHKILKELFDLQINKQIELINIGKTENEKIEYKQLYYFTYKDNARMMTIGGIIYKHSERHLYQSANFNEFKFIRGGNENYEIEVPILTLKERKYLDNGYMFNDEVGASTINMKDDKNCLSKDRDLYNNLHRYLPNFIEADEI